MKRHIITHEEYIAIKEAYRQTKQKKVAKRLEVLIRRYEGESLKEVGEKVGFDPRHVSALVKDFKIKGLYGYINSQYGGNNRKISKEREEELLKEFEVRAQAGELITVKDIKETFDKEAGRESGRGYIYMLLERHGWRMVMPRSKHPNKASEEDIETSKKLTIYTMN